MSETVVDVGALEVIRATGADRVAFLHRLLTGDVAGIAAGGGGHSLLLSLKGQVISDIRVFALASELRLVVPPAQGEATAAALNKYAVMDDFTAAIDPGLRVLAIAGPRALELLSVTAGPPWSHVEAGDTWVVRARFGGADGAWVFAAADTLAAVERRLGLPRLPPDVAEVRRIAAGEPRWGAEITDEYFPMEVGLDGAIDYAKGCFLGQEPIIRIRDRGHINWRLVGLKVTGPTVPTAGDALESDTRPRAGRVTSAGQHAGGPPVALALLHVSVPVGAEVRIKHGEAVLPAVVVQLPPAP